MSTVLIVGSTGYTGLILTRAFANAVTVPNSPIKKVYALIQSSTLTNPAKAATVQVIRDIPNVEIRGAVLDDVESVTEAFKGVDIIVSALASVSGLAGQVLLIEAAKNAGVKRFVPSNFGLNVESKPSGYIFDVKYVVHEALFASGLKYTIINNGGFYKHAVTNLGNFNAGEGVPEDPAVIYGDGTQVANFVDTSDIAAYTVQIVVDPRTENREVWLDNKLTTQQELIKTWEKITGQKLQKTFVSKEDTEKELEKAQGDYADVLLLRYLVWFSGLATAPSGSLLASELYPETAAKAKTIEQYLGEVAKRI